MVRASSPLIFFGRTLGSYHLAVLFIKMVSSPGGSGRVVRLNSLNSYRRWPVSVRHSCSQKLTRHPSQGECLGWPVDNVSMVAVPCSIFADLVATWFVSVFSVWVTYCSSVGAVFRLPASWKTSHPQHCYWMTRVADSRVQTSWRMPRRWRCLKWKR